MEADINNQGVIVQSERRKVRTRAVIINSKDSGIYEPKKPLAIGHPVKAPEKAAAKRSRGRPRSHPIVEKAKRPRGRPPKMPSEDHLLPRVDVAKKYLKKIAAKTEKTPKNNGEAKAVKTTRTKVVEYNAKKEKTRQEIFYTRLPGGSTAKIVKVIIVYPEKMRKGAKTVSPLRMAVEPCKTTVPKSIKIKPYDWRRGFKSLLHRSRREPKVPIRVHSGILRLRKIVLSRFNFHENLANIIEQKKHDEPVKVDTCGIYDNEAQRKKTGRLHQTAEELSQSSRFREWKWETDEEWAKRVKERNREKRCCRSLPSNRRRKDSTLAKDDAPSATSGAEEEEIRGKKEEGLRLKSSKKDRHISNTNGLARQLELSKLWILAKLGDAVNIDKKKRRMKKAKIAASSIAVGETEAPLLPLHQEASSAVPLVTKKSPKNCKIVHKGSIVIDPMTGCKRLVPTGGGDDCKQKNKRRQKKAKAPALRGTCAPSTRQRNVPARTVPTVAAPRHAMATRSLLQRFRNQFPGSEVFQVEPRRRNCKDMARIKKQLALREIQMNNVEEIPARGRERKNPEVGDEENVSQEAVGISGGRTDGAAAATEQGRARKRESECLPAASTAKRNRLDYVSMLSEETKEEILEEMKQLPQMSQEERRSCLQQRIMEAICYGGLGETHENYDEASEFITEELLSRVEADWIDWEEAHPESALNVPDGFINIDPGLGILEGLNDGNPLPFLALEDIDGMFSDASTEEEEISADAAMEDFADALKENDFDPSSLGNPMENDEEKEPHDILSRLIYSFYSDEEDYVVLQEEIEEKPMKEEEVSRSIFGREEGWFRGEQGHLLR